MPIEQIRSGDWILTYPQDQAVPSHRRLEKEYLYSQVVEVLVHDDRAIFEVEVMSLADDIIEYLRVTPEHPFFVERTGWLTAQQLNATTVLTNMVFGNNLVGEVVNREDRARVYTLRLTEHHTFYVGNCAVWVHGTRNGA